MYYGLLSGVAFSLSYAIAGIFSGIAVDRGNRAKILSLACVIWSLSSVVTGKINSLAVLGIMRITLGFSQSAAEPAMYSLISNYFPAHMISTANSVLMTGCYLGGGFSSLSVNLVKALGWRESFSIIGFFGITIGILSLIILKEPQRKDRIKNRDED